MATGKASGKKKGECPKSGCIKKVGSNWRVVSNKTGKLWPAKYKSRDSAKKALAAYHNPLTVLIYMLLCLSL